MKKRIKNYDEYVEKTEKGAAFFNQKKYKEALGVFLELAHYNDKNYKVFETLARIHLKLDNIKEADEAFCRARLLHSEQTGNVVEIKTFDEIIAGIDDIQNLEAAYTEQQSVIDVNPQKKTEPDFHKIPIMMSMKYMSVGEFKKAEELLISHKNKYCS